MKTSSPCRACSAAAAARTPAPDARPAAAGRAEEAADGPAAGPAPDAAPAGGGNASQERGLRREGTHPHVCARTRTTQKIDDEDQHLPGTAPAFARGRLWR